MSVSTLSFIDAMRSHGLTPPDVIEPGKLHRFPGDGKGPLNTAGWCKLFPDGVGGVFGDFSTGLSEHWQAKRDKPLSPAERSAFAAQCVKAKRERERIREAEQVTAATNAAKVYAKAGAPLQTHPYLVCKGITAPDGVRQSGPALLVPMCDAITGKLRGLQAITGFGDKRFTSGMSTTGCAFTIEAASANIIGICEGMATGASIHEATGWMVVCAFSANNLPSVAEMTRQLHPKARLVICADNDHGTDREGRGNAGIRAGLAAAKLVRGLLLAPPSDDGSDWNDFAKSYGLKALRKVLMDAIPTSVAAASEVMA